METINSLIETLKVVEKNGVANIYDFDEHAQRLLNSAFELGFTLTQEDIKTEDLLLYLKNLVKNEAQYFFKDQVLFYSSKNGQLIHEKIFKLRIILHKNSKHEITIEPYTRDLNKNWTAKLLNKTEFHIDSTDPKFKHKFYPRLDLSQYLIPHGKHDEVIWINEKNEICEGSFTNIFFQDTDGNWFTPCLSTNILPGIARAKLIKELQAQEISIKVDEINKYPKVFLSNSLIGLKVVNLEL